MWNWTATKIAIILRTAARYIPEEWTLCPSFDIWPLTRNRAVLWMLAQLVIFRQENYNVPSLMEYISYVRLSKEMLYTHPRRRTLVAKFLMVVHK
jgi:hypothetical protein